MDEQPRRFRFRRRTEQTSLPVRPRAVRPPAAERDLEWEQTVFAGLLALTEQGRATWHLDPRLGGAMRCDIGGESFWLFRGRLMIDEQLELPLTCDNARKLAHMVGEMHRQQARSWIDETDRRRAERRARVDQALAIVTEAGEHEFEEH
jgi:hypothetical protein